MAFFWTKERLFEKSVSRFIYLVGFGLFFILTETGRRIYRPWIYHAHINDFGVADTIGNSLGTLTQIFLYLGLANATRVEGYRITAFVTVGYIAYEIVQPILPRGTFDWKDVIATVAAGFLAAGFVTFMHLVFPNSGRAIKVPNK